MRIFDCILYNGERELLDIRVKELEGLVTHVLVESELTFTGLEKDPSLMLPAEGYEQIVVCKNDMFPFSGRDSYSLKDGKMEMLPKWQGTPWDNERVLRNTFYSPLRYQNMKQDDIIILSDVDEIPRREVIEAFNSDDLCCLQMDEMHLYLNTRYRRQSWRHPKIFKYQYLLDHPEMTFDMIRAAGGAVIEHAGWHFSSVGGTEEVLRKLKSFSHQEPEIQKAAFAPTIEYSLSNLRHLHTDEPLEVVPITGLPKYVQENQQRFKHLLHVH